MKIKSLFLSDLHLGCRKNRSPMVLDVLKQYDYDNLFLLGDIIDIKALAEDFTWTETETKIWDFICEIAKTKHVVYTVGNHERCYFNNISYHQRILFSDYYIYNNMYLCHGHQFDTDFDSLTWPKSLVAIAYNGTSKYNLKICSQLKRLARRMPGYLSNFKNNAFKHLENRVIGSNINTIIVGHTHQQEYEQRGPLHYYNCGDFREDHTYIVETTTGKLELADA